VASGLKRIGDVEINQDLDFQRRCWTVQRIGWIVMAVLVLSALLGVFGAEYSAMQLSVTLPFRSLWNTSASAVIKARSR
jgi:hypothetical protein